MKKMLCSLILSAVGLTLWAYTEPADTSRYDRVDKSLLEGRVVMSWVSGHRHYRQNAMPGEPLRPDTVVAAWRGERLGLQVMLMSGVDAQDVELRLSSLSRNGRRYSIPGSWAAPMRHVLTTDWRACGYPADTLPTHTVADMIELPETTFALNPGDVRPLWVTIDVPRTLEPGVYTASVEAVNSKTHKVLSAINLSLNVNCRILPAPHDYAFYLDLWQQPYAVARYYGVKPWSREHFDLLQPYAQMLARAGQKTVTTILFYEPWGEQSHDKFEPMVQTTLRPDGTWAYDYADFDAYVEFMARNGVDANISCFTMIPWEMRFRYLDEATGELKFLEAKSDSPEYAALWTDFLQHLASHLKAKGWYDKTMIVMDERGLPDMLNAYRVAKQAVPGIKMSLAGSYHSELVDSLDSYALVKGDFFPQSKIHERRSRGQLTLMYTCCATEYPSQFSNSDPADGAYIPLYATATGHDGYLHWSFMNWTDNPLEDSRFRMFAPGDTFFVYPDGRSSLRYERMLEGIQMSEKLRMLRDEYVAARDVDSLQQLEDALLPIRSGALNPWYTSATVVSDLHTWLDAR